MDAKLIVVGGQATKSEVPLVNLPVLIGRNRTAALPIAHPLVSRNHCEIFEIRGALVVRDLESANGTRINDELIAEEVLRPGDRLTVGPLTFVAIYKFAGEVPDLESLRASEEESGPFFDEAVDDPVSLSAEDIVEADIVEEEVPKERPKVKPKPGEKQPGKKSAGKKVSDREATLEFNSKDEEKEKSAAEEEDLMDLKLEDLLLDSAVDPGKREPEPTPRATPRQPNPSESGLVSPYSNSGVQVRREEGVITRHEVSLKPNAPPAKGGAKSPAPTERPAKEAPAKSPAAKSSEKPAEKSPQRQAEPKAPPKPPATVQMASSIDGSIDMAMTVEDSEDFLLEDSGVSNRATLTDKLIDVSLDAAIIEASSDSFDAVKLLTGTTPKPPDRNPRGAAQERSTSSEDDKHVVSFVLPAKEWGNSGVHAEQLQEKKQPTDFLLRLQLPDAGKIRVGTPVRVAGIDVGMVTDLNWVATSGQLRAEALLNIQKRLGEVLRDDCQVRVHETGEQAAIVIENPGATDKHLENGQVIQPAK